MFAGVVKATVLEELDGLPFVFGAKSFRQAWGWAGTPDSLVNTTCTYFFHPHMFGTGELDCLWGDSSRHEGSIAIHANGGFSTVSILLADYSRHHKSCSVEEPQQTGNYSRSLNGAYVAMVRFLYVQLGLLECSNNCKYSVSYAETCGSPWDTNCSNVIPNKIQVSTK